MLIAWVAAAPGTSNVINVPSRVRRKPCTPPITPVEYPVIAPAGLMLAVKVSVESGGSIVVTEPSRVRRKP